MPIEETFGAPVRKTPQVPHSQLIFIAMLGLITLQVATIICRKTKFGAQKFWIILIIGFVLIGLSIFLYLWSVSENFFSK